MSFVNTLELYFCICYLKEQDEQLICQNVFSEVRRDSAEIIGIFYGVENSNIPEVLISINPLDHKEAQWISLNIPLDTDELQTSNIDAWTLLSRVLMENEGQLTMGELNEKTWVNSGRLLWPKIFLQYLPDQKGTLQLRATLGVEKVSTQTIIMV